MTIDGATKRLGLFAMAAIVLVAGFALIYFGSNSFAIRSAGLLLCVISTYLVKVSRRVGNAPPGAGLTLASKAENSARPGTLSWVIGVIAVVAFGSSFFLLYRDAVNGYQQVWPVYVFGAAVVICAPIWAYLFTKLMW